MLYWICPECGHECSPAIRECPTCTAPPEPKVETKAETRIQAVKIDDEPTVEIPAAIAENLRSLARNFEPSTGLLTAGPQRRSIAAPREAAVAVAEPEVETPPSASEPPSEINTNDKNSEPELSETLAALDRPVFRPSPPTWPKPVDLSAWPIAMDPGNPALTLATASTSVEFQLQPAGAVSLGTIDFSAVPTRRGDTFSKLREAIEPAHAFVALVRDRLPAALEGKLLETDLRPLLHPLNDAPPGPQRGAVSGALVSSPNGPSLGPSWLEAAGESLAELRRALEIADQEREQEGIRAIEASFQERPAMRMLPPSDLVIAPAPPSDQWMRSEKPKFTPIPPEYLGRTNIIAGPQAPPLAGPSLPAHFLEFGQPNRPRLKHKRLLGWPLTLAAGTVLLLTAASLLRHTMDDRDAKPPQVTAPARTSAPAPAPSVELAPLIEEHPAAKSVEVAGIRIVATPYRKPQLEFVVINHSSAELTGLNIRVAVHSLAPGSPALFRTSSIIPALGPNQAKELRADLDVPIKAGSIPDWHSLRTEVVVARQ